MVWACTQAYKMGVSFGNLSAINYTNTVLEISERSQILTRMHDTHSSHGLEPVPMGYLDYYVT